MLKDEIEKKSIKKRTKKIDPNQPGLTCQTCDPCDRTRISQ
jgi:hypothetical protein